MYHLGRSSARSNIRSKVVIYSHQDGFFAIHYSQVIQLNCLRDEGVETQPPCYYVTYLAKHTGLDDFIPGMSSLYIFPDIATHSLTPCSRIFLEKLTGSQLVMKFPAIYGTRRFITTFTSPRNLSLS